MFILFCLLSSCCFPLLSLLSSFFVLLSSVCIGSEESTCPSSQHSTCLASQRQMAWLSTRHMSYVSTIRYAQCSQPTQRRRPSAASTKGGCLRPPPFVGSFVLAVNTGHILLLRRKTCALLRAKTSALLRRKTCAVLRARTCALFRAKTKVAAFGRHHRGGRPSAATPLWFPLYWL